jgi:hypothetical protein
MVVLPVGQNCHLGAALVRYGYLRSSLFKWADVSCRRITTYLGDRTSPIFAGYTAYRVVGSNYGTVDHGALLSMLPSLPNDVRINTIAYDHDGQSYAHGVQLTKSEALSLSAAHIDRLNQEKINHLEKEFIGLLEHNEVMLLRLEFGSGMDLAALEALMGTVKTIGAACRFAIIAEAKLKFPGDETTLVFNLSSRLPSGSDVMNVTDTYLELESIFDKLLLSKTEPKSGYIFDL